MKDSPMKKFWKLSYHVRQLAPSNCPKWALRAGVYVNLMVRTGDIVTPNTDL